MDANHNGTLERDDCDSIVERFREYGDLTDDQADRFKSKLKAWWDQSFKEFDKVPFEEFMKTRYEITRNSSSQDALEHFKGNLEIMFDAIDTNGDGVISVKEWRVYHLSMNIDNEEMTKRAFETIDLNNDGKMSLDEFITGAFDFLYNQEDSIYKEFLGPLALL